jgi:hypothetical protein
MPQHLARQLPTPARLTPRLRIAAAVVVMPAAVVVDMKAAAVDADNL